MKLKLKSIGIGLLLFFFSGQYAAVFAQGETLAAATLVIGEAWYERANKKIRIRPKTILYQSDLVFTANGKVHVQLGPDVILQLAPYSSVRLTDLYELGDIRRLKVGLEKGTVYSKIVRKLPPNSSYEIRTPTATAGVRGTEFIFTEGKSDKKHEDSDINPGVYVNEGKVRVSASGSKSALDLTQGEQVKTKQAKLQKEKLDKFMKKKMAIFAHLEVMKEKNYKMLKELKEKNTKNINDIINRQKDLRKNLWK